MSEINRRSVLLAMAGGAWICGIILAVLALGIESAERALAFARATAERSAWLAEWRTKWGQG